VSSLQNVDGDDTAVDGEVAGQPTSMTSFAARRGIPNRVGPVAEQASMMLENVSLKAALSISVVHRSDGDFPALVRRRLQPRPVPYGCNSDEWHVTARIHGVLLPTFSTDELVEPQELVSSFMRSTVPQQNALALHLKFVQADAFPQHLHFECVRSFLMLTLVQARNLPVIMIAHKPSERGFVDAPPAHIHSFVLARQREMGGWGRTTDLMFDRQWQSLIDEWNADHS
jgi:hypothetical protein